jgi:hypothetical protein
MSFQPGITDTECLLTASADATPTRIMNSEYVSVDESGYVKLDTKNTFMEDSAPCTAVYYLVAGTIYNIRNVVKAYKLTTLTGAKIATSDASTVVGVKLHR